MNPTPLRFRITFNQNSKGFTFIDLIMIKFWFLSEHEYRVSAKLICIKKCTFDKNRYWFLSFYFFPVPPGIPEISRNKTDALIEDDYVMFTCDTNFGNPAPEITWFRKTETSGPWEELTGGSTTPPAAKFGSTRSVLTRVLTMVDHQSQVKCSALNEASQGSAAEMMVTLDVRCKCFNSYLFLICSFIFMSILLSLRLRLFHSFIHVFHP